ncbi:rhomboid family intramembrane serine protease [Tellurirhabdus rosea]|uniref:rhomboid family intramembrane serine protease n=1 Tax=Tellurirhabdus rosea TaxID=2674997 RepID=UPI00225045C0|nr:rhomboid family intramembrane serine protease [Tellurirhabdus rosea]
MSITLAIIVITVLVSVYGFSNQSFLDTMVLNPPRVFRGQWYRLITSGFVHADMGHLIFNMISLYFFGRLIEMIFNALFGTSGPIWLLGFYLLSIVVANLPSLFRHRNHSSYNSLGASGGVSALLFSAILFQPLNPICVFLAICIPGFIFAAIYMAYSFYGSRTNMGYINHDAHLYGALFGVAFMVVVYPPVISLFVDQIASWRLF